MPPPSEAVLPDRVLPLTVSVPSLWMPPPAPPVEVLPDRALLLTVRLRSLGPTMVRFFLMSSSPLVSVMVWPTRLGAKTMVSPLWAAAMSARSEPAPLSRLFRTVSVLGTQRSSSASSVGRTVRRAAGVFFVDTDRGDRLRRFDSQRVNDIARVSFSRSVCGTMKKPAVPARKPSAGARPGRRLPWVENRCRPIVSNRELEFFAQLPRHG